MGDTFFSLCATTSPSIRETTRARWARESIACWFRLHELTTVGEPIPLPEHVEVNSGTSAALFTVSDNGMMAYYPVGRGGGPYQIAWYGRDGKSSAPLATGYFYGPALSP